MIANDNHVIEYQQSVYDESAISPYQVLELLHQSRKPPFYRLPYLNRKAYASLLGVPSN